MIIIRRIRRCPTNASFGFPNPFERISNIERGAKYNQQQLQKALNKAKTQGKDLRDPNVLASVMKPVAQKQEDTQADRFSLAEEELKKA